MKLPPRVKEQHGRYYLLGQSQDRNSAGKLKRRWIPLSKVADGPAALYDALAGLHRAPSEKSMASLVARWKREELPKYAVKTRIEYERMCAKITEGFEGIEVEDIEPGDVADFVDQWKDAPRASNAYKALLSLILAFGCRKRYRSDNPAREVRAIKEAERSRYLTDAELAAIKAKSSAMTVCLIDLALVTGQRIGDLLSLKWSQVTDAGIVFRPAKVKGKTDVTVPIRMTPRLRAVLDRCRQAVKVPSLVYVVTTRSGQPITYSGAHSAWIRACKSAGVEDAHFHDLRHRAITDAERQGKDARRLGGHSSKAMTQRYIEAAGLDWIDPPEEAQG